MRFALITREQTPTNLSIVAAMPKGVEASVLEPEVAVERLEPGDTCLGRLDVLESLDGIADGLWCLGALEARGVRVLNPASALLASHDKLLTARLLHGAGLPHPRTAHVSADTQELRWRGPVVVKPRFGSWGREVTRCTSRASLRARLDILATAPWFQRQGVLVQELIPCAGHDLRIVVAHGKAVGAIRRVAAPGEWRTNVALGATREATSAPRRAKEIAIEAAEVVGGHLIGVDLVQDADGSWTILEVNGAVEFNAIYRSRGPIFPLVAERLLEAARRERTDIPVGASR